MTFKEAACRIEDFIEVYNLAERSDIPKTAEAFEIATKLLLWMNEQPEWILEGNIVDLINEYYNSGLRAGFDRAVKKVYNIKD